MKYKVTVVTTSIDEFNTSADNLDQVKVWGAGDEYWYGIMPKGNGKSAAVVLAEGQMAVIEQSDE